MSLFESIVFSDQVKVISSDDDGSSHLCSYDNTLDDSSSDADIASEWALLINISTFNGVSGSLEAQTNVSEVSQTLSGLAGEDLLAAKENTSLLVESSLNISHFG